MRKSVNRLNTGTRKNEGEKTFKIISGTYENTEQTEAVPNNRQFEKIKSGYIHKINRPTFKYKEQKIANEYVGNYVSKRTGTGNYNIRRPNFKAEVIRPRNLDFEKVELQSLADAGQKVALGDETIAKLFAVQIADPSDGEWLLEVQKRRDAGETDKQIASNPPFRRPQRTITKNINFATRGLRLEDKIELLQTAVISNSVETQKELKDVATAITLILADVTKLNISQTKTMGEIVNRLNLPKDPFEAGLEQRIYSLREYQDNIGLVNFYIYSRAFKEGGFKALQNPIEGLGGNKIKLSTMLTNLQQSKSADKEELFLDVVNMSIVNREIADRLRPTLIDDGSARGDIAGLAPTEVLDPQDDMASLATTQLAPTEVMEPSPFADP